MKPNELRERIEALEAKLVKTEEAMLNAWGLAIGGLVERIETLEAAQTIQPMGIEGGTVEYTGEPVQPHGNHVIDYFTGEPVHPVDEPTLVHPELPPPP